MRAAFRSLQVLCPCRQALQVPKPIGKVSWIIHCRAKAGLHLCPSAPLHPVWDWATTLGQGGTLALADAPTQVQVSNLSGTGPGKPEASNAQAKVAAPWGMGMGVHVPDRPTGILRRGRTGTSTLGKPGCQQQMRCRYEQQPPWVRNPADGAAAGRV